MTTAVKKKRRTLKKDANNRKLSWRSDSGAKKWSDSQDWEALFEEFCELSEDGSYEYPSIRSFAEAKASARMEELWIARSVGSVPNRSVPWRGNWLVNREIRKRDYSLQVVALRKKIDNDLDMLERSRVVGDSYHGWTGRVDQLIAELDEHLGGKLVRSPSSRKLNAMKTAKERNAYRDEVERANESRLKFAMTAYSRILKLKTKIDDQYLKCIGWNRPSLIAWISDQIQSAKRASAVGGKLEETAPEAGTIALGTAIKAILKKSAAYDLDIPDDLQDLEVDDNGVFRTKEEAVSKNGRSSNGNGRNGHKNGRKKLPVHKD